MDSFRFGLWLVWPLAFPWYMTFPSSCDFAVTTSCVCCMRAISALRSRILLMISNLLLRVLISATFVDTSVRLLCPSFRLMLVVSVWFRFILESCSFVLRRMFLSPFLLRVRFSVFPRVMIVCVFYGNLESFLLRYCIGGVFISVLL